MGAALGCCGGPSTDYDVADLKTAARYHPLLGRCDTVEKSLLRKLQRGLSTSWSTRLVLNEALRSPLGSESDSDDDAPPRTRGTLTTATSGSRLLCDFYNLVLECDHSKFFVDEQGRRVKGAYLREIDILEDYFDTYARTTVGSRRRRRESVDVVPYQPPQKLKHLGHEPFYDRSSNMSLMSNDTSQTLASESDYWATFADADEPIDFVAEMTFPPRYGAHYLSSTPTLPRARRDSVDRRRAWVFNDAPNDSSPFLLFSPVNTRAPAEPTAVLTRQRTSSRSRPFAVPTEGSRYNLWGDHADAPLSSTPKELVLPAVFSSAAVSERRRASLTMGSSTAAAGTEGGSRRLSMPHASAVAPIAV